MSGFISCLDVPHDCHLRRTWKVRPSTWSSGVSVVFSCSTVACCLGSPRPGERPIQLSPFSDSLAAISSFAVPFGAIVGPVTGGVLVHILPFGGQLLWVTSFSQVSWVGVVQPSMPQCVILLGRCHPLGHDRMQKVQKKVAHFSKVTSRSDIFLDFNVLICVQSSSVFLYALFPLFFSCCTREDRRLKKAAGKPAVGT